MKICRKCLMPDTRPRIEFDSNGVCSACEWDKIKKTEINWEERRKELEDLCNSIRGKHKYDCLVPVSGGKDSTYVANEMKNKYNLKVLTVTITPPLETKLIQDNLSNFLSFGFDNVKVTPNPKIAKEINKFGFIEQGRPLLSWTSCLNSVLFNLATIFDVPLIMFGEEGETEYGGLKEMRNQPYYDSDYAIKIYCEGNNPDELLSKYSKEETYFWRYPSKKDITNLNLKVSHYSYFEDWDPYAHFVLARDKYGMKTNIDSNVGTYTNYAQLDTPLYELHTYLMYLKFGFGRCLQDACIDIRKGRISREEALSLCKQYDGNYPKDNEKVFLEYFDMSKEEFEKVLDKHVNKKLFSKVNGEWLPKFELK